MREPDYRGISAAVIAICGAVGVFVLTPAFLLISGRRLDEIGSDVLIAIGGVLVGAFAAYMGQRFERAADKPADGYEDPTSKDEGGPPA